jgi:hypothetical protein
MNEDNAVDGQYVVAKPTTEVMAIDISAVVTMDDADAVDCQQGEDEALEATKRINTVTKEHACEAEALEETDTMGAAALDKYVPAAEGMLCVGSSFSRSRAVVKSLPAADGMVGEGASFLRSRATKMSSAVTNEHACEAEALEDAEAVGGAALDKYVPDAEGMVGMEAAINKGVVTVIDLATSPCSKCPHKNAWVAMMIKSDNGSGTHKAAWEEMMLMPGHGANKYSVTRNYACKADTWSQREDHIHIRGVMLSDALSLDMRCGTSVLLLASIVLLIWHST